MKRLFSKAPDPRPMRKWKSIMRRYIYWIIFYFYFILFLFYFIFRVYSLVIMCPPATKSLMKDFVRNWKRQSWERFICVTSLSVGNLRQKRPCWSAFWKTSNLHQSLNHHTIKIFILKRSRVACFLHLINTLYVILYYYIPLF